MYKIAIAITLFLSTGVIAQTEIYNEDFQSGIPTSYTLVDNDGLTPASSVSEFTPAWIALEDPEVPGDTVAGSTSYFDPTGRADRWLITPAIMLGASGNVLFWEAKSHDASFPDSYDVYLSTTDTQLSSFTDTLVRVYGEYADWTTHELSLDYDNISVYIAFVNRTNDGFKLYLDDIRVEENNPLGLDELTDKVHVYPNPFTDHVTIEGAFDYFNLSSQSGKILLTGKEKNIILSEMNAGVYFLQVFTNGNKITRKLVKY